jgi:apolipoprotein N-acyltransferase
MRLSWLVDNMREKRDAWRKFGVRLMATGAALAFSVWANVRGHPEQDLPLWPAWTFAALCCAGLGLTIAARLRPEALRAGVEMQRSSGSTDNDAIWTAVAIVVVVIAITALFWVLMGLSAI